LLRGKVLGAVRREPSLDVAGRFPAVDCDHALHLHLDPAPARALPLALVRRVAGAGRRGAVVVEDSRPAIRALDSPSAAAGRGVPARGSAGDRAPLLFLLLLSPGAAS